MGSGDDIAAGEELTQAAQAVELVVNGLGEEARGEVKRGDAVALQHLGEQLEVAGRLGREDNEASAVDQRSPDLERGGVEGDGGQEEEGLLGGEVGVGGTVQQAEDGAVLDGDALGPAGGAGGEVDVGEVARGDARVGRGGGQALQAQVVPEETRQGLGDGELRAQGARGE